MYRDLEKFLQGHIDVFNDCDDASFVHSHELFIDELAHLESINLDGLPADRLDDFKAYFSGSQKKYLALREFQANEIIEAGDVKLDSTAYMALPDEFSRSSYNRVEDLTEFVDFSECHRVVMVGCGSLPATLLWLGDHYPDVSYVGLDIENDCVVAASNLIDRLGRRDVSFHLLDGGDYDYSDVDFVYVANHVSPKKKVLSTISATASVGLQVVVREPTLKGQLFAESVGSDLPEGYSIRNFGVESDAFLSFDLSLIWQGV